MFPCFFSFFVLAFMSITTTAQQTSPLVGCVVTKSNIQGRLSSKDKSLVEIPADEIVSFVGKNKSGNFYQIRYRDQLLWVPSLSVKHVGLEKCQVAKEVIRAEENLKFRLFLGSFLNSDSKALKNLLISVPNPSSVASLPNPIVTDVKKGSGFEIGGCGQQAVWKLQVSACAGYLRESFTVISRPNPAPPSDTISLDSLSTVETDYQFQAITGDLSSKYDFQINRKNILYVGLGVQSAYYLGDAKGFEYRTGTVFKAESTTVPFGPKGFVIKPFIQIGYDYRFLSGSFIQSIGLELDVKSTGDFGIKLGFGI